MDAKVSRKETRYQSQGAVDVLMSDIVDLYPVYADEEQLIIADIEMLDGERDELLDRAMWAAFKQRGNDPLNLTDGNQHEECILGEISPVVLMAQITANVLAVGPGVQIAFDTQVVDGKEFLTIELLLTNAV